MTSRLVAVTFDAHHPADLATFWAGLLDRAVVPEADGALLPGDPAQVGLRFVSATTERSGPNRLHLHLTTTSLDDEEQTVEQVVRLGGEHRLIEVARDAGKRGQEQVAEAVPGEIAAGREPVLEEPR